MVFSGDGKKLVLHWPGQPQIEIFDVASGKLLNTLQVGFGEVLSSGRPDPYLLQTMIASSDGKLLASYAELKVVTVWDMESAKRKGELTLSEGDPLGKYSAGRESPFPKGVFSPDGRCLTLILDNGPVVMYELATAQVRRTFGRRNTQWRTGRESFKESRYGHTPELPYGMHLAVSHDGQFLAHADSDLAVRLWDISRGAQVGAFRGHTGPVTAVAFTPDGKSLASAGWDTTVLVWDVNKFKQPAPIEKLGPQALAANWELLAGDDATKAFDAIVALTASPNEAVAFIEQRLKPAAPFEPQRMRRLIDQLDSKEFKVREEASSELLKIGEPAVPALDKALAGNPPLETRRRLQALRDQSVPTSMILKGDRLRGYRAVEVLERIGTPEARRLLTSFAEGAPGVLLTTSATAALKR
jgi:hypothetical protein